MKMSAALEFLGATKTFRDFWGRRRVAALADVTLAIPRGSIVALLGRNGAGKTTLLSLALGLLRPTAGSVRVLGGDARDAAVRRRLGYLPEESSLHGFLTARETLRFHAGLCGLGRAAAAARTEALLELVGLEAAADRTVAEFSKGMARRLCLAQALVGDPELLVLDEPTSGLDPLGVRMVKDLLLRLASLGRTIFLSSHVLGEVEEVAHRIAILDGGRLLVSGSAAELLAAERHQIVTAPLSAVALARVRALLAALDRPVLGAGRASRSLEELFLEAIGAGGAACAGRSGS
jgi:ABC-2 type transport system ATP-binding protein